jgi:glutamate synthase domain-containing protein 1
MMMMVPEPWTAHESMSEEKKAFYEYHACLMEPWDGPASIAFTDGTMMGQCSTATACDPPATP